MSEDDNPTVDGSVIEFGAFLRRKRDNNCQHVRVEVDESIMSLTCMMCGAEIDPWWWLRTIAERGELESARFKRLRQEEQEKFEHWCENANATIARLNGQIQELTDTKNRLWNEHVNGAPLGAQVRRRRSRSPRPA